MFALPNGMFPPIGRVALNVLSQLADRSLLAPLRVPPYIPTASTLSDAERTCNNPARKYQGERGITPRAHVRSVQAPKNTAEAASLRTLKKSPKATAVRTVVQPYVIRVGEAGREACLRAHTPTRAEWGDRQ